MKSMEEDIKYLKTQEAYEMYFRGNPRLEKIVNGFIDRIKELEKSEEYIYEAYQDAGKIMFKYAEELENSIPKSLIKEKIEEIKEKIEEAELEKDVTLYSFIFINQIKMRALEELLNTKM